MKSFTYSFEKLEVWNLSRQLVKEVYDLTSSFPRDETYGMISQLRRATVSVSNNLAEGSSRKTQRDQAHFTQIAFSSLMEVLNMMILSVDLNLIQQEKYLAVRPKIEQIGNMLNALRNSQNNRNVVKC
jgi:four helix bundle protein